MIILPLIVFLISLFLTIKLSFLGVRFSDTNVYFYTAYQLLQGKILYKDIFFTNLPLFPYLSALYVFVTGGNILGYYLTSAFEVIGTAVLIYFILVQSGYKKAYGLLGTFLYLSSFIVLSTAEHQTGIFTATFLATLSYFLFLKKKYFFSGFVVGLVLLVKLYFVPIFAAYILYLLIFKRTHLLSFVAGWFISFLLVLIPTIVMSGSKIGEDVFFYSFFRGAGLDKLQIFLFFVKNDPIIVGLLVFNLFLFKKNTLLFFISLFSLAFLFVYQDVYYLYFNLLVPFAVISIGSVISLAEKKTKSIVVKGGIVIIVLLSLHGPLAYLGYAGLQNIANLNEMVTAIQKEKPDVLYGTMEITPALAYLSHTPLLNNIVDTNTNMFRKKIYDAHALTQDAIQKRAVLVMIGLPSKSAGKDYIEEIFDENTVRKRCAVFYRGPASMEFALNEITLWKCY